MIFTMKGKVFQAMLGILLIVCLSGTAFSTEYYGFHRGTRTLGMGGAFTAVADDYNAVFYNPAGLAGIKGFNFGILNPMVEVSKDTLDLYGDYEDIDDSDETQVTELMKKYVGGNNHITVASDIHVGFKKGSVGVMVCGIGKGDLNIRIRNPTYPEAHISSINDYGGIVGLGYNVPMLKGLKVGVSLKGVTRKSLSEVYTADLIADDDLGDMIENDMQDGTGFSADVGALYTLNILKLTDINLAVAGINIPKMDFGNAMDAETQFNVGVALRQKLLGFTFIEAVDVYDLTDNLRGDESYEKKLHAGVEVQFPMLLSARIGMNQGYYTAGLSINIKMLKIEAATYGEELGVIAGQKEDRRYSARIAMGWLW